MTSFCTIISPQFMMMFQKVTTAGGTLGFLLGEGIQRGVAPSGAMQKAKCFSSFKTTTGGRELLMGGLAVLGLAHAYRLYTKKTPW